MRGGRHRDGQGNVVRAAVLGAGDGLITDISLVLGVAGAKRERECSPNCRGGRAARRCLFDGRRENSYRSGHAMSCYSTRSTWSEASCQTIRSGEQRERAIMHQARGLAAPDADTVARVDDQPCGAENIVHPE